MLVSKYLLWSVYIDMPTKKSFKSEYVHFLYKSPYAFIVKKIEKTIESSISVMFIFLILSILISLL